eukprot:gnl/TRDRNA2_/TRDRNA2_133418_c0_seq2.p1 gnl/TRDRNA2_/TRDRNA2_133418_c0~~gnl/TRDRNA2_/TRDRNA2_133418_c0_seq2.p1  ORF type:complete len:453 (-),score=59.38 gnl/TRDRNA2_/TRDRNA2_133418_c0_seq2:100-1458(-)
MDNVAIVSTAVTAAVSAGMAISGCRAALQNFSGPMAHTWKDDLLAELTAADGTVKYAMDNPESAATDSFFMSAFEHLRTRIDRILQTLGSYKETHQWQAVRCGACCHAQIDDHMQEHAEWLRQWRVDWRPWASAAPMPTKRWALASTVINDTIYSLGGYAAGSSLSTVECLSPSTGKWTSVAPMLTKRRALAAAAVGDRIYAIGGHDGGGGASSSAKDSFFSSVECLDVNTGVWSPIEAMATKREYLAAATSNGAIYALGGDDGDAPLWSVERLDPRAGSWSSVAPMLTRRWALAAVASGDSLYAIGGHDGQNSLNSVERFDLRADRWVVVGPMSVKRRALAAAAVGDCIYALGGHDGQSSLVTVERYDPRSGQQGKWSPVSPMVSRRRALSAAVVDETLFALGGFDDESWLASVERFDSKYQGGSYKSNATLRIAPYHYASPMTPEVEATI